MPYLSILIVSFLATLSLALPVAREKLCSLNSSRNGNKFRLLSVSKQDRDIQMPLAIGSNSDPQPNSDIWLGVTETLSAVVAEVFIMDGGGITAFSSDGRFVGVSEKVAKNGALPFFYPPLIEPFEDNVYVAAEIYCELARQSNTIPNISGNDTFFTLAVNGGDSENFELCQSRTGNDVFVIYKPLDTESQYGGFDPRTCTGVHINIIPESE